MLRCSISLIFENGIPQEQSSEEDGNMFSSLQPSRPKVHHSLSKSAVNSHRANANEAPIGSSILYFYPTLKSTAFKNSCLTTCSTCSSTSTTLPTSEKSNRSYASRSAATNETCSQSNAAAIPACLATSSVLHG
jgi:hypothetical protein